MNNNDKYRKMGFKCGLEIHQQLLTEKKLYCRCPAGYRNDRPHGQIIRHMRPTLSELGEYDGTALMEFKTKKNVTYQLYRENSCTYEMDDTPPFPINQQALEIALKLSMLLNCAIVDELHVSRKQYLDGSIPTGFQRTAIVGVDGWVPYKGRKINITHICLEEDACREISDNGHEIVFRTDRLSMPLLEVITAPDMLDPTEAMEVNALIGRLLKASGLVRRGIGSVRQDVNVSITGGERAEIKGVPKTGMIEKLTAIEAERQVALLGIKETLRTRGISDKTIHGEKFDLTGILSKSKSDVVAKAAENSWMIKGIKLDGFARVMNVEVQPGKTFADELSGRIKVIACLDQIPNIAVSDLPEVSGFDEPDWAKIKSACGCKHTDAVVVTWGPEADVATALSEIKIRAIEATRGIPLETRQAEKGGVTGFERVLPGADRMYPDTDSPPVKITKEWLDRLRAELPKPAYAITEGWEKRGVPLGIAEKAVVSSHATLFNRLVSDTKTNPGLIWSGLKKLSGTDHQFLNGNAEHFVTLFKTYESKKITRDSLFDILGRAGRGDNGSIPDMIKQNSTIDIGSPEVKSLIDEFKTETADMVFRNDDDRINYICGRIKARFGGRVDGAGLRARVGKG
ncbi:MAG: Glu-tRNA(Gln) amidotransferase subunit GatE [candidate division Zixibacteria bacterium]